MSPAHVLEPTYRRLKHSLMEGVWPQGAKLEALKLADEFGVSMTPVRDSLNRLVGERLVQLQPGDGYRVPRLGKRLLCDLLVVNAELLISAVHMAEGRASAAEMKNDNADFADRVSMIFTQIARRSSNTILAELVSGLGERLHVVRRVELAILHDAASELDTIEALFRASDPALCAALRAYHQRRQVHASDLLELLP